MRLEVAEEWPGFRPPFTTTDSAGSDALLGQADAALYAAKLAGRDGFNLFGSVPSRVARFRGIHSSRSKGATAAP